MASFYMEGPILSWYQWMSRNGFLTSWAAMLQALEFRFTPSSYEEPHGALFKLIQKGYVNDYLTEFERLTKCIMGLAPPFLLSCFISDLNLELWREVQAFQPLSLPQAIALTKLQEDKLLDCPCHSRSPFPFPTNPSSSFSLVSPLRLNTFLWRSWPRVGTKAYAIYHCEDKWVVGHRC